MCWAEPPVDNHGVNLGSMDSLSCMWHRPTGAACAGSRMRTSCQCGKLGPSSWPLISLSPSVLLQSKKEKEILLCPKSYLCLKASALAWTSPQPIDTTLKVVMDTVWDQWSPGHSMCWHLMENQTQWPMAFSLLSVFLKGRRGLCLSLRRTDAEMANVIWTSR